MYISLFIQSICCGVYPFCWWFQRTSFGFLTFISCLFPVLSFIYLFLAALGLQCGAWVLYCCIQALSSGGEQGLLSSCSAQASHCGGFSYGGEWAVWHVGSVAVAHGLSCPMACGILAPRLGIEPLSPALAGGFLTTGPPEKSLRQWF